MIAKKYAAGISSWICRGRTVMNGVVRRAGLVK